MTWASFAKWRVVLDLKIRVDRKAFLTVIVRSNMNKSCKAAFKSFGANVCMKAQSALIFWSNKNNSCRRHFTRVFSIPIVDQTRTRDDRELMRIEKREFV